MQLPFKQGVSFKLVLVAGVGAVGLMTSGARAQEAAPAETAPAATGASPEPAAAAAAPATPPAPPAAATPAPPPPMMPPPPPAAMAAPAMAPEVPLKEEPVPIKTVFGLRTSGRIQGGSDPKKLNDVSLDTLYLEARFSGSLDKYFGWQANFNGNAKPAGSSGPANIMDMILKIDADDAFHVWAGRLLVPSDRSNFSGPFFMSPWNYPGVYSVGGRGGFIGPKTGATGRDDGVVVWGEVLKGKGKYFLGAFNLDNVQQSPLYSGRINIALLGEEPGFWGSSTYYGDKDIVAIGGAYQYQKHGSGTIDPTLNGDANLSIVMGDLLAEKNVPGAGTFSLEGTYYHFDKNYQLPDCSPATGPCSYPKQAFYVLASFLTADYLGIGKLQPLVRWQQTTPQNGGTKWTMLDAFVTYVIHAYDLKLTAGYQRTDLGNSVVGNAIQVGFQIQE